MIPPALVPIVACLIVAALLIVAGAIVGIVSGVCTGLQRRKGR